MNFINIEQVIDLKKEISKNFNGANLHFQDSCGGQAFSFEEPVDEKLKNYIFSYFEDKGLSIKFTKDNRSFVVKERNNA